MHRISLKKSVFSVTVALLLVFCTCFSVCAENTAYHWYCKRNKEHKQPTLDPNMAFIELYQGYYIDRVHNDQNPEKVLYLTFDAGYENGNVAKILDILKEEGVLACFFVLEHLITKEKDLVSRMVNEGHTVANHTASHKDMSKVTTKEEFQEELGKLEAVYRETIGGEMPKYFRPPEGTFSEESMHLASELGYSTIFWSFAYADWDNKSQPSPDAAKAKIMQNLHNGEVMLLHPTSATNASILRDVIRTCKEQGYRFGTIDELVQNQVRR